MQTLSRMLLAAVLLFPFAGCSGPEEHPVFSSAQATEGTPALWPSPAADADDNSRVYEYY